MTPELRADMRAAAQYLADKWRGSTWHPAEVDAARRVLAYMDAQEQAPEWARYDTAGYAQRLDATGQDHVTSIDLSQVADAHVDGDDMTWEQ